MNCSTAEPKSTPALSRRMAEGQRSARRVESKHDNGEMQMNYSKAIFLISDETRAVNVTYEQGDNASRTLFKTLDPDIAVGDYVVVQTCTRHHMTVCKVVETDVDVDFDGDEDIKWIVGTVHTADFDDLVRQEQDAITKIKSAEKRRRRKELKAALLEDAEEIKALPIYSGDE